MVPSFPAIDGANNLFFLNLDQYLDDVSNKKQNNSSFWVVKAFIHEDRNKSETAHVRRQMPAKCKPMKYYI